MSHVNSGRPAFPIVEEADGNAECVYFGLTKREWMATKLLAALVASGAWNREDHIAAVTEAVALADHLLIGLDILPPRKGGGQ